MVGRHVFSVAMVRLRCTLRVLKRFRLELGPEAATASTLLSDRYANPLNAGRSRWPERALYLAKLGKACPGWSLEKQREKPQL